MSIFRSILSGAAVVMAVAGGMCLARAHAQAKPEVKKEPGPADVSTDTFRGEGLSMRLASEVKAVQPGVPFLVGLHIRHDPEFHTYWKNPGIAGVATKITWTLPAGWQAGPLLFPPPDKVLMAGYVTHGFEHDVLLLTEITPPADAAGNVKLDAEAIWMCCARTCHPGWHSFSLTLPVSPADAPAEPDPAWKEKFTEARKFLPADAAGWTFSALRRDKTVVLTGHPPKGAAVPEKPQFFSDDFLICSHPEQVWTRAADGSFTADLPVSAFPPAAAGHLSGLLTGSSGWLADGTARAVQIRVPLSNQ